MLSKGSHYVLTICLALLFLFGLFTSVAQAVWHNLLAEHFSQSPQTWPEQAPGWTIIPYRPWNAQGNPHTWGIQDYIFYSGHDDSHSIWCVGRPADLSAETDPYPPNTNCWANYGPFSLANAAAARATFYYRYETENNQDSLAWGAGGLNTFYCAGSRSGPSTQWYNTVVNFDSIPNGAGWLSFLGQSQVYLKFHFVSNGVQLSNCLGAFIDEINIAYDDGLFDLVAQVATLATLDSLTEYFPQVGDSLRFALSWVAYGTNVTPRFDITCRLDDSLIYTERRNVDIGYSYLTTITTYTTPFYIADTLPHTVSWLLDASYEIQEFSETNNDTSQVYQAMQPNIPPTLVFTSPILGDTVNAQCVIQYDAHDPDNVASFNLYWTEDTLTGLGNPIIGAVGLQEHDTTGSFAWNTSSMTTSPVYIMGIISDGQTQVTSYSPGPVVIDHTWGLPAITVTSPAVLDTADTEFLITWSDSDHTASAMITLYWDPTNSGHNGTLITPLPGIPVTDPANSFLWNTTTMLNTAPGLPVWIYAQIQNINATIWDYAPAGLVILHPNGLNPWPGWEGLPAEFALENVYPNPFNSSTTIRVALPRAAQVEIQVFDAAGRLAAVPFRGQLEPGRHDLPWTPNFLPSGIYLVKFTAAGVELQSRAVYLK